MTKANDDYELFREEQWVARWMRWMERNALKAHSVHPYLDENYQPPIVKWEVHDDNEIEDKTVSSPVVECSHRDQFGSLVIFGSRCIRCDAEVDVVNLDEPAPTEPKPVTQVFRDKAGAPLTDEPLEPTDDTFSTAPTDVPEIGDKS